MKIRVELEDGKYYFAQTMRAAMVRAYRNHRDTRVFIYAHEKGERLGSFFWKDRQ